MGDETLILESDAPRVEPSKEGWPTLDEEQLQVTLFQCVSEMQSQKEVLLRAMENMQGQDDAAELKGSTDEARSYLNQAHQMRASLEEFGSSEHRSYAQR